MWGDGWYGFNVDGVEAVRERLATLHRLTREAGRDPARLETAAAVLNAGSEDVPALADAGLTQLVLVETPPEDPVDAMGWAGALAARWSLSFSK